VSQFDSSAKSAPPDVGSFEAVFDHLAELRERPAEKGAAAAKAAA
jgi:hypothetical protein